MAHFSGYLQSNFEGPHGIFSNAFYYFRSINFGRT